MTIMGPTSVRSCPHCDQLIREDPYISGNTCDDQHWTDGYMEALMLPNLPDIVKCPTCYAVFWINKAKELGDYNPAIMDSVVNDPKWFKENNPEYWEKLQKDKKKLEHEIYLYRNSLNSEGLNEGDYLAFPDNNKLKNEQERHIRTMAWWKANDSNRGTLVLNCTQN
jgi:hypothetical protein